LNAGPSPRAAETSTAPNGAAPTTVPGPKQSSAPGAPPPQQPIYVETVPDT
jgi:hypothetical protein